MENLKAKEKERKAEIKELKKELERARGADKERLEKKLKQKKDMLAKQRSAIYSERA
jgi:predicted AlkP superfamily phosphohydrolase/phosphomutase